MPRSSLLPCPRKGSYRYHHTALTNAVGFGYTVVPLTLHSCFTTVSSTAVQCTAATSYNTLYCGCTSAVNSGHLLKNPQNKEVLSLLPCASRTPGGLCNDQRCIAKEHVETFDDIECQTNKVPKSRYRKEKMLRRQVRPIQYAMVEPSVAKWLRQGMVVVPLTRVTCSCHRPQ